MDSLHPLWTPPSGRSCLPWLYLKDIVSGGYVCDVHPLAVDVMAIDVPAAHSDSLLAKVGTLVTLLDLCGQGRGQLSPRIVALPKALGSA